MEKKLNVLYIYVINLFLISIPLIGKERELLRLVPLLYFLYLFVSKKITLSKGQTLLLISINIYILLLLIIFKNKDLVTYIYIFSMNIFLINFEERHILKRLVYSGYILILLYIVACLIGFLKIDYTDYRNRLYFIYRESPTIMNAPFWGNVFYSLSVMIIIKYKNIKSVLVAILLQMICYKLFNTRGPILCSLIFIVLFILKKKIGRFYLNIILNLTLIILVSASIIFPIYFEGNYYLNKITSNRLIYWSKFLKERSFEGFFRISSVKELDFSGILIVDNSFLHLIFNSGVYLSLFIIFLFIVSFKNLKKENKLTEMVFIISFFIYCFLESILFRYEVFATIYFWYLIIKNIKIKTLPLNNFVKRINCIK